MNALEAGNRLVELTEYISAVRRAERHEEGKEASALRKLRTELEAQAQSLDGKLRSINI